MKASVEEDEQPVRRSIALRGKTLAYTATPGHLTIRNDKGEPIASMFYTAYTIPSAGRARPVTFLFNGGPGSSTMWLHMGSFGPMKVDASLPEMIAGPPFRYGANPDTLLDITDLVFIDAPTTGLSRELGKAEPKDFFGVDKDADAFTRTIQRYLTKYGRWNAPKFIIGESYGTTRAAALSKSLSDNGVQLNGIVLVSTILNLGLFGGDDQALIEFLPTYAADAWYHGKIQPKPDLMSFVGEARAFAGGPYAAALQKGAAITDEEKQSVAQQMARLTGLVAGLYPARQPSRAAQPLPARAAARPPPDHRPDRFALRRHRGRRRGRKSELRSAGERDHRRLHRRHQRLSVPRPRLQNAAQLPGEQLRRDRQRLELPAQLARRPAVRGQRQLRPRARRCARTRG